MVVSLYGSSRCMLLRLPDPIGPSPGTATQIPDRSRLRELDPGMPGSTVSTSEVLGVTRGCQLRRLRQGPGFGNNISHSHRRTSRRWNPNIQRVRTVVSGTPKRVNACTSCIKAEQGLALAHQLGARPLPGPLHRRSHLVCGTAFYRALPLTGPEPEVARRARIQECASGSSAPWTSAPTTAPPSTPAAPGPGRCCARLLLDGGRTVPAAG